MQMPNFIPAHFAKFTKMLPNFEHRQKLPTDLETFYKLSFLVLYSKKQVFKNRTG